MQIKTLEALLARAVAQLERHANHLAGTGSPGTDGPEIIKALEVARIELDNYAYDADIETAVAVRINAKPEDVATVLEAPMTEDGRSDFQWFRLCNGDLLLGVFPHGDTYMEISDALDI